MRSCDLFPLVFVLVWGEFFVCLFKGDFCVLSASYSLPSFFVLLDWHNRVGDVLL